MNNLSQSLNKVLKIIFFTYFSFIFLFFLIVYFIFFLKISHSQSITDLQNQISDRNNQILNLQKEIDAYNSKVATTQAEAKSLKSAIANLESQKTNLKNQIALTNIKIEDTKNNLSVTQNNIIKNEEDINKNRASLIKTLNNIRSLEENNNLLLNLLNKDNKNFSDNINQILELNNLNNSINKKIEKINFAIENLNQNKMIYEKQKNDLTSLNLNLSGQKTLVEQNSKDKNTLLNQTKNQEKTYQQIINDRKKKVIAMKTEIDSFESQIKYILDKSKLPTSGSSPFSWPLSKVLITQRFGNTAFANSGAYNGKGHNGVDFGTAIGTPIYSVYDGTVMGTGDTDASCPRASYGKWILIRHTNGLASLYAHLSVLQAVTGQSITKGQQIGLSGNTGYSTGPHLHFTVLAADAVKIFGPREYKSRTCGTFMIMPYAPQNAYLNPLDYLPK